MNTFNNEIDILKHPLHFDYSKSFKADNDVIDLKITRELLNDNDFLAELLTDEQMQTIANETAWDVEGDFDENDCRIWNGNYNLKNATPEDKERYFELEEYVIERMCLVAHKKVGAVSVDDFPADVLEEYDNRVQREFTRLKSLI